MTKGKRMKWVWGAVALAAMLGGCATVQPTPPIPAVRTVRLGEFTVRLYTDRQRLEADIERVFIFVPALRGAGVTTSGFYDRRTKTVYATDDPLIVLHELKHALEPGWNHAPVCGPDRCLDEKR